MKSYWEQLRDPRWQRKRLEVMELAQFMCEDCQATDKTLNIHHTYYERGHKPWEYDAATLRCLCEDCHATTEEELSEVKKLVGALGRAMRQRVIGYLRGTAWHFAEGDLIAVGDMATMFGVADAMRVELGDVIDDAKQHEGTHVSGGALARRGMTRSAIVDVHEAIENLDRPREDEPRG